MRSPSDPGIAIRKLKFSTARTGDLVVGRGAAEELRYGDAGFPFMSEKKVGDIEAREIHPIM